MRQLIYLLKPSFFKLSVILLFLNSCEEVNGQVNLQTGSATFSIPMFNWEDHRSNLTTTIGLSYNSGSGLKVNDIASEVGTGWSMIAGGVITRMQVGEPDDQIRYGSETNEKDINKYPAGYLYADNKSYRGCPEALTKYPLYKSMNQLYKQYNSVTEDKQLDYFAFQFNGKSGMFVLNAAPNRPNGTPPTDIGLPLGDTKLKITFQRDPTLASQGIRTTITSFTIQDVDGLLYKFSKHGLSELMESKYFFKLSPLMQRMFGTDNAVKIVQPNFKKGKVYYQTDFENSNIPRRFVIGSWYLTEIKDPQTNRIVTLNYDMKEINSNAGVELSYNQKGHYSTIYYKRSKAKTPQLSSILYPDGHTVQFHYDKPRVDLTGANALTAVDIKYGSRYISKYLIKTTYFILNRYGTPVTDFQKSAARLCLKSVQKVGVDLKEDSPPYIFDYYTGSNDPNDHVPFPFDYKRDIWGYYNGDKSLNTHGNQLPTALWELKNDDIVGLCFLREISGQNNQYNTDLYNVKPNYARNGLLRQIIYPTGGTLSYNYKQNAGYLDGQTRNVGGVHVFETVSTDGGYSNGCENPIKTTYNYELEQGGASSLWGIETPVNSIYAVSHYEPKDKKYKFPILGGGLFGSCTYKYKYPGILSIEQSTNLSDFMKFMETVSPVLNIMGSVSTVLNAIKVFAGATGVFAIVSLAIDVASAIYTLVKTCFSDPSKTIHANIYYNFDLNSISPLPAQFKRVEIIENPGTIGKTVHEFTSDDDYAVWHLTNNETFANRQRFGSWLYGLPKSTTVYKANGDKVKQTINEYDTTYMKRLLLEYNFHHGNPNASGLMSNLVSCKCMVTKTSSQRSTEYNQKGLEYNNTATGDYITQGNGDMKVAMYGYYTGRLNLVKIRERVFKESNPSDYLETVSEYSYNYSDIYGDPGNFEVGMIRTQQSNGDKIYKYIYYTTDFANEQVINALVQQNVISLPVRTNTIIYKAGDNTARHLSDERTEFTQVGSGAIKPLRMLEKRFASPSVNPNTVSYTEVKRFFYDAAGNLTGVVDEGDRSIVSLYEHDDKYVTASIINAGVTADVNGIAVTDKIAYTSFETSNFGGWSVSGITSYTNTFKVTGERGCQLNAGSSVLTANSLNQALAYRLSFWATAAVSVTGGGTQVIAEPTISGFTYYEYEFPVGTSSVSISGNAIIDELRLYPKKARMSTVTYDPLLGKTSECDQNNRITYYEYDELGRMRFIKDEKRNIVKMYEYNNVSKQNGCPGVYYNKYIKEGFTKNNCGPGYISDTVYYEIPANKYSSTISQEDADAQAENELLSGGQNKANEEGECIPLYCNEVQSITVYSENCPPGFKASYTYIVPAGRYCTTVSVDSANKLALEEIEANAQAYVNDPDNILCVPDYDADWEADENAPTQCMWENGQAYIFIQATDVNPNSSTYGQTSWRNTGQPGSCENPGNCSLSYSNNTSLSQTITFTNANTSQFYSFTLPANHGGIISIPQGYYDVQVTNNSSNTNYNWELCGLYFASGASNVSNAYIGCSCLGIAINDYND